MYCMSTIAVEQAVFIRPDGGHPQIRERSPLFAEAWLREAEQLMVGFGERPAGYPCPAAIFASPLGKKHVAIVQVADRPIEGTGLALGFHVLVLAMSEYRDFLGDPFLVADQFQAPWHGAGQPLMSLALCAKSLKRRSLVDVQAVLKRVKSGALREGQDPQTVELTVENSDGPALLGGVQVLVDGGKLVFVRPGPDEGLIRGLWTLLPDRTRRELWPATFAFGNELGFDALVVPSVANHDFSGYTTEEQAADYPTGHYELSLQTAAEAGDQSALDRLFARRSSGEVLRLAVKMVLMFSLVVLLLRWPLPANMSTPSSPEPTRPAWSPEHRERAAVAAAMASSGDPWTAFALHELGRYRRVERVATAAGIAGCANSWAAAVQAVAAQRRYADIWTPVPGAVEPK
jgi:hypothetical protein